MNELMKLADEYARAYHGDKMQYRYGHAKEKAALQSAIQALQADYQAKCSELELVHESRDALQVENERLKRDVACHDDMSNEIAFLRSERDALAAKLATPDMFWNADDAEQMHHSIDEFLNDEICNGVCEVGGEFEIQRAIRLPNIKIRVTAIDDESCEAEYEVIDAAKGGQQ